MIALTRKATIYSFAGVLLLAGVVWLVSTAPDEEPRFRFLEGQSPISVVRDSRGNVSKTYLISWHSDLRDDKMDWELRTHGLSTFMYISPPGYHSWIRGSRAFGRLLTINIDNGITDLEPGSVYVEMLPDSGGYKIAVKSNFNGSLWERLQRFLHL